MSNLTLESGEGVNEDDILWRYMDLGKFVSLLDTKSIWLARADTVRDKQEGRFPDDMRRMVEEAYKKLPVNQGRPQNADDFQEYLRKNTYLSCWHKNEKENLIMWELYGRDSHGIAIQTTVRNVDMNLDVGQLSGTYIRIEEVKYESLDEVLGELRYEDCFFYKRPHFSFEGEVRISFDTYNRNNPTKCTPLGYRCPVLDLNQLIEKVLVHPDSEDWFFEAVTSLSETYRLHPPVERGMAGHS